MNSVCFSDDSAKLLLGCESGEVMEMEVPGSDVDNHKTYEVTLPIRYYDFVLPKPPKAIKSKSSKKLDGEAAEGGEAAEASAEGASEEKPDGEEGEGEGKGEGEGEGEGEVRQRSRGRLALCCLPCVLPVLFHGMSRRLRRGTGPLESCQNCEYVVKPVVAGAPRECELANDVALPSSG